MSNEDGIDNQSASSPKPTNPEPKLPQSEQEPKIDTSILDALNLTSDEVQRYGKEQVEKRKYLADLIQKGRKYYEDMNNDPTHTLQPIWGIFKNANFTPEGEFLIYAEIPDACLEYIKQYSEVEEGGLPVLRERLNAFLNGLGTEALDNFKDWKTAIVASDIYTEGGIINDLELISKMGTLFSESSTTRVEIAKFIQERINRRKAPQDLEASSATSDSMPENPGTLRPVPDRTIVDSPPEPTL